MLFAEYFKNRLQRKQSSRPQLCKPTKLAAYLSLQGMRSWTIFPKCSPLVDLTLKPSKTTEMLVYSLIKGQWYNQCQLSPFCRLYVMSSKPISTEITLSIKYCDTRVKSCWTHSSKIQLRLNRLKIVWLNNLKIFVSAVKKETSLFVFMGGLYPHLHN